MEILDSVETLQAFIGKFGYGGMAIFVIVQIIQVVIPILPGGISCLGGVIFFGPWLGFLYNYVGSALVPWQHLESPESWEDRFFIKCFQKS